MLNDRNELLGSSELNVGLYLMKEPGDGSVASKRKRMVYGSRRGEHGRNTTIPTQPSIQMGYVRVGLASCKAYGSYDG